MTNDSKSVSYKAEKQLCNILTDAIIILRKIEEKVGRYEREYPNKIWNIYEDIRYSKLPSEIECNDDVPDKYIQLNGHKTSKEEILKHFNKITKHSSDI